uniref:Uncharacterized protein n=1 Tax=Panagrolaimus davidi TaxID=227884 RepID=A0A914PEJ8_9BILA
MRYFVVFSISIFATIYAFPYTSFPVGEEHVFMGNVRCANGNPIADHAVVVLRERDDITGVDDIDRFDIKAAVNPGENGMFELTVPKDYKDPPTSELELFLEFWNVCFEGEEKTSGFLKEKWWVEYVIDDNEIWAQPRDPKL